MTSIVKSNLPQHSFESCSSYNNYMDDDELIPSDLNKKINNYGSTSIFNNIKKELKKKNIPLHFFHSISHEYKILDLLYDSNCDSKEYIVEKLNKLNKTYDNTIFILLNIPIVFNYIFSKYGNYGINGLNISSFLQCCNMDFLYLAKIISSMIRFTKKDVKSIFSQCCIKLKPHFAQLMCNIHKEACIEVSNDNIVLDNIMISLKNYLDYIEENYTDRNLFTNKEIDFNMIIKIFTSLNPNNIYYYGRKIICINSNVSNITLTLFNIKQYTFLRSRKLEILDNIKDFTDDEKSLLSKISIKDEFCGICYENKPNVVSLCKNNEIVSKHQFCNSCMSILLLNVMCCPICRCKLSIHNLQCITTDIRKFK